MLLKNHLIEVFKKASLEKNFLLKENIVLRWAHRFGVDSLNDLLMCTPVLGEYRNEEENQEQISLIEEVDEEENQEQISLIEDMDEEENQEQVSLIEEVDEEENQEQISLIEDMDEEENQEQISLIEEVDEEENQEQIRLEVLKNSENLEEIKNKFKVVKNSSDNGMFSKYQNFDKNVKQNNDSRDLPLPNIKNLRKWINNYKKAS